MIAPQAATAAEIDSLNREIEWQNARSFREDCHGLQVNMGDQTTVFSTDTSLEGGISSWEIVRWSPSAAESPSPPTS